MGVSYARINGFNRAYMLEAELMKRQYPSDCILNIEEIGLTIVQIKIAQVIAK